jgi:hypothetical protein
MITLDTPACQDVTMPTARADAELQPVNRPLCAGPPFGRKWRSWPRHTQARSPHPPDRPAQRPDPRREVAITAAAHAGKIATSAGQARQAA